MFGGHGDFEPSDGSAKGTEGPVTRILKLAIVGAIVLAASLGVLNQMPNPWDLVVLILGATCIPLAIGLVTLSEVGKELRRGPKRLQAAAALILGLAQFLFGGRLLLGIFGWH